ncbi:hypothetical protein B0T21DRAFT_252499, partial [Apiosordaria backusii]
KTAMEMIPIWHQPDHSSLLTVSQSNGNGYPYPGDIGFIPWLNSLIIWYDTYNPVGLLGLSRSKICDAIFHDTGLGALRQDTLRRHWEEKIRLYRCRECNKKWEACVHRSKAPRTGGTGSWFGMSDDPVELMDDLLVCFGPPKQSETDHDWGRVPRMEFANLEEYENWL